MRKIVLTTVYCYYFTAAIQAQTETLLKGKIGNYPIVMQLTIFDDTVANARYFYENQKRDIDLTGIVRKDGSIQVRCYNNYEGKFNDKSEKFVLKKVNDHYTGTWSTTKKSLPVDLAVISVDAIKHPFANYDYIQELKKESPLDYVRTAGLQFIKDSTKKKNNYFLDWYHEKYSGIRLLRIRKDAMTDALKGINEYLEETQLGESNAALSCTSPVGQAEYNQDIDHIFINENILSIDFYTGYDCGGAHPDFSYSGLNYDLTTGAEIKLDDVLWFGKTKTPKENSDGWYQYRDSVFAPKIVALLKQLYPKQMKQPTSDEECDYSDPEVWNFVNWYFTPKGIYFGAYFARVARSCDEPEWPIVPYSIVRKYMNPALKIKLPE